MAHFYSDVYIEGLGPEGGKYGAILSYRQHKQRDYVAASISGWWISKSHWAGGHSMSIGDSFRWRLMCALGRVLRAHTDTVLCYSMYTHRLNDLLVPE